MCACKFMKKLRKITRIKNMSLFFIKDLHICTKFYAESNHLKNTNKKKYALFEKKSAILYLILNTLIKLKN